MGLWLPFVSLYQTSTTRTFDGAIVEMESIAAGIPRWDSTTLRSRLLRNITAQQGFIEPPRRGIRRARVWRSQIPRVTTFYTEGGKVVEKTSDATLRRLRCGIRSRACLADST